MALEQRLELKMLQKLILTPQLQQAIKLLQLPQLELSQTISNELIENPMLEEVSDDEPSGEDTGEQSESSETAADDSEKPLEKLLGFSVDEYFDSRNYDGRDLGYFSPDQNQAQTFDQFISQGEDLCDHLTWQIRFSSAAEKIRSAAEVVVGNLDENGYLPLSDEEIANFSECSLETAAMAVALVQSFDPPGIAARNLKECLLFQLKPLALEGTIVEHLITNDLRDIEGKHYQKLAAKYNCTMEDIKNAVKIIEGLEPKPGRGLTGSQPIYIKPDVYVIPDGAAFRIVLSDESVPPIRINNYYKKLLMQKNTLAKEEREYLNERLRSAVWLLKSLDHRNKTIYRVTESIVNFQRNFFEHGVSQMKPLNLRDVAQDLSMHESTISRATSNKFLSCGHGLFNFRFFFSSGIQSASGTISSASIKDMIKKIAGEEDSMKPLSDQKIADMLSQINMKVARRTVAKYRDELNIAPQNLRRRI